MYCYSNFVSDVIGFFKVSNGFRKKCRILLDSESVTCLFMATIEMNLCIPS